MYYSELVLIPSNPHWYGSKDKRAVIFWCNDFCAVPCIFIHSAGNFVAIKWRNKCDLMLHIPEYSIS